MDCWLALRRLKKMRMALNVGVKVTVNGDIDFVLFWVVCACSLLAGMALLTE
jgi:hypothetical protein